MPRHDRATTAVRKECHPFHYRWASCLLGRAGFRTRAPLPARRRRSVIGLQQTKAHRSQTVLDSAYLSPVRVADVLATLRLPAAPWYHDSVLDIRPAAAHRLTRAVDRGAECRDHALSDRVH